MACRNTVVLIAPRFTEPDKIAAGMFELSGTSELRVETVLGKDSLVLAAKAVNASMNGLYPIDIFV